LIIDDAHSIAPQSSENDFFAVKTRKMSAGIDKQRLFKKHHCIFFEYPQNESSLFAVFR